MESKPCSKGLVDVHHHLVPPAWLAERYDAVAATNRRVSLLSDWTPQRSLEEMDRNSIAALNQPNRNDC